MNAEQDFEEKGIPIPERFTRGKNLGRINGVVITGEMLEKTWAPETDYSFADAKSSGRATAENARPLITSQFDPILGTVHSLHVLIVRIHRR